jgi:hypothetical protein
MHHDLTPAPRSLATLVPGEEAVIEAIFFGALRALCADIGIREGGTVRCRGGTGGVLLLVNEDGRTVSLARDWARYIRISPEPIAATVSLAS